MWVLATEVADYKLSEFQLLTLGRATVGGKSAPPWEALWTG